MSYKLEVGRATLTVKKAAAEGDDWPLEAVLATTAQDRDREALTVECMRKMADVINLTPLDLVDSTHDNPGIADTHGYLNMAAVRPRSSGAGHELYVQGGLFGDDPSSPSIARQITDGRVHLSIGGRLPSFRAAHKARGADGLPTMYLDEVDPLHGLLCRKGKAVNPETWVRPIHKAISDRDAAEQAIVTSARDGTPLAPQYKGIDRGFVLDVCKAYGMEAYPPMNGETVLAEDAHGNPALATAVVIMPEHGEGCPPSTAFADNVKQPTAEETYWDIADDLQGHIDALRATVKGICGADAANRVALLTACLADFAGAVADAISEDIAKADGAKLPTLDPEVYHRIIGAAQDTCGCDHCRGLVHKATANGGSTDMAADTAVVETPAVPVVDAAPPADPPVPPVATDAPAADAADDGRENLDVGKAMARLTALESKFTEQVASKDQTIADLRAELDVYKAKPASGGPASTAAADTENRTATAPLAGQDRFSLAVGKAKGGDAHEATRGRNDASRAVARVIADMILQGSAHQ